MDTPAIQRFEGASGDVRFKRTGRRLGRFPYRLLVSQTDSNTPPQIAIEVGLRPVALRRVLARQSVGDDGALTLTLEDGRCVDLWVHYDAGRFANVTVQSGLYSVARSGCLARLPIPAADSSSLPGCEIARPTLSR